MTFRKPSRSLRTPFSRSRDVQTDGAAGNGYSRSRDGKKRRDEKRRSLLETLENRQLLAGPQLIGIQPNEGELLVNGKTLGYSPNELVFRFDDNATIDADTLDAIRITRAGEDGTFESASVTSDLGTGGQALFEFRARQPGSLGNGITIVLTSSNRPGSAAPIITTNDRQVTINVNSNPTRPTRASDLIAAVNNDPNASSLIEAIQVSGPSLEPVGTAVVPGTTLELTGANAAQAVTDFGTNGAVRVRLVSQIPGEEGRGIEVRVEQRNFGGTANPVVVVTDQVVRVQLNSFAGDPTTADEFVAAINNNPQASQLLEATVQEGDGSTTIGTQAVNYSPITLSGVSDVVVQPGYVGLGDSPREVVFRFQEPLPDDLYQIDILGSGPFALRGDDGEPFQDGTDLTRNFAINLGPQVVAVVPEPIRRNSNGSLSPETGKIQVHFNDDDLNPTDARNPDFYQLIYTGDTVDNTDDQIITPTSVSYSNVTNVATLDFGRPLSRIFGQNPNDPSEARAVRLRIGTREGLPSPPTEVSLQPNPSTAIEPGDSFDTAFDLNSQWSVSGATTTRSAYLTTDIYNESRFELDLPGPDVPGTRNIRPDDPTRLDRTVPLDYLRGGADSVDGISVVQYDFAPSWLGDDPNRPGIVADTTYFNIISEQQRQRVREVLSLFSEYLGVTFVEVAEGSPTDDVAFSIAVGDLYGGDERVVSSQGGIAVVTRDRNGDGVEDLAVMDFQDFDESVDDQFGDEFFRGAMFAVGQLLGYGYADDLPQPVTQSTDFIFQPGTDNEPAFPSYADIVHGQYLFRPDSTDIDMYRFELDSPGSISIETIAERLSDASLLDTQLRLYRADADGAFVEIAQNDDYFSNDSLIRLQNLQPGTYMIGVSAKGNNDYDPTIPGTGFGGLTEGSYELRLDFTPDSASQMKDLSGRPLDGDADGRPGGTFNYWFEPADPSNTLFVDKAATGGAGSPLGSVGNPYREIDQAILDAQPGDTIRIVGNGGIDGRLETPEDNFSYQIGFTNNGVPLADGISLEVPKGVNMVIDSGAILKFSRARVGVGSVAPTIDLSDSSLQVLGTPTILLDNGLVARDNTNSIIPGDVYFTSINDDTVGTGNQVGILPQAQAGDWGGIDFRGDLDTADESRRNLEREGIFLNHIQHANLRYGGGAVSIGGRQVVVSPIDMAITRPTIINSSITDSADAAIAATPDTFKEDRFTEPMFQGAGSFTPDYDRVGPEIHGNTVVDNSINGLFVRLRTRSGSTLETVGTNTRFDDTDIPHVITENLVITGTPGGAILQSNAPSSLLVRSTAVAGDGNIPVGTYTYRLTNVSNTNLESAASQATVPITTTATGGIRLQQLPTVPSGSNFVARRLYRATIDPLTGTPGPFRLVAQLNASSTSYIDRTATGGAELSTTDNPLRSRLDASLVIDAGTVVKVDGARIEARFGANLIAEGTSSNPVVLTSLEDQRYGGGGTFDTNGRGNNGELTPGDWGGIYVGNGSSASIDNAVIAGAGGTTRIEGGFASFNAIELHQADLRLANSRIEFNADGRGSVNGSRVGRMDNAPGVVFVRGSQPVLVGNEFLNNDSAAITVDLNSLNYYEVSDHGRATGNLDAVNVVGNSGPLVQDNSLTNNAINGMFVRGGELVTESIWDDVNIVHVVTETIAIPNKHIFGGLRLVSDARGSLVVKFESGDETAGIVVGGNLVSAADQLRDIPDRIGGAMQLIGHPDFPVVLTSLSDDSAGAGFTFDGKPQVDTNNDGLFFTDIDSSTTGLPTGPEVNNGTLIDNDVDSMTPGSFSYQPGAGGDAQIARTTVQGLTQVFQDQNSLFEYSHWIDVGADGGAVRLSTTNITTQPTLIADDRVISEGNFQGENGLINWRVEQYFVDGQTDLVSELSFDSDQPLGNLRVINYYDPVIGTDLGDVLFTEGTPGLNDFRLTILDAPEEIGFRQYGTFEAGPGLVNANYEGWIADSWPNLIGANPFNAAFVPQGTINLANAPLLNAPQFPQPNYGTGILTSAMAWTVDTASSESLVTTNLEVIAEVFGQETFQLDPGQWHGVTIREGADDRNVKAIAEQEPVRTTVFDTNSIPSQSQFLGELAPDEQSGDENQRLGFIVDGAVTTRDDVDVYSFIAESGTEVWLDIDRAGSKLDTVVELIDFNGNVLAASNDSILAESNPDALYVDSTRIDPDAAQPLRVVGERLQRQQLIVSESIVDATGGSLRLGFDTISNRVDVDVEDFLADPAAAVEAALNTEYVTQLGPITATLLRRQERKVDANGIITRVGGDFVIELEFNPDLYVGTQPPNLQSSGIGVLGATVTTDEQTLILQSQVQDTYSYSTKDAGMRIRLPGETGTENLYHIRVRSSNTRDPLDFVTLTDPNKVRDGLSTGRYSLQVRLRETDETAGTQVNLADVRFATNGIQVIGQPFHSPLLGEEYETTANNDLLADAQRLGYFGVNIDDGTVSPTAPPVEIGPLSSDRLAKSFGGALSSEDDVDWYQFEIQYDDITRDSNPLLLSTIFDLDYASNFARSDMALYVFNGAGNLIYTGTDSNVADDLPGSSTGNDTSDLSRGSAGTEDPFIGSVELGEGTYYLAVSNQTRVPISMDQFFNPASANPLVRLAPISAIDRVAVDNIVGGGSPGSLGGGQLFDGNSIVPYTLDDVVLYVNTFNGLQVVNPFTGQNYGTLGNFGDEIRDVAFRSNGELYGYTGYGNRAPSDTNWFYHQIDTGNATLSAQLSVGGGIETYNDLQVENNAVQILDEVSDDGLEVEAIAIKAFGGTETGFMVANRPFDRTGEGLFYYQNILYEFDETSGQIIGPTANRSLATAGAGTSRREIGQIDTTPPGAGPTTLGFPNATVVNAAGQSVAGLVDGDFFTITSGADVVTFELDQGTTLTAVGTVRDEDTFVIDGRLFEFNSGARLQIDNVAPNGTLAGGETVTVTGSAGQTVTFEFVRLGQPTGNNVGIPTLDANSQPLPINTILNDFASKVNQDIPDARASIVGGEVVFGNISGLTATGPGVTVLGDPSLSNAGAIEVAFNDTDSPDGIIDAMDAAIRGAGIAVSSAGNQLALPNAAAVDVSGTPGLSRTGAPGVAPGNERIELYPTDSADTLGQRIVEAIENSSLPNVMAQLGGRPGAVSRSVEVNGAIAATSANFNAGGVPNGGLVTGIDLVGNTLYAVTNTGGLYSVDSGSLSTTSTNNVGRPVTSATDLVGLNFTGLRAGPRNVDGGYGDILFGITANGDIHAFNVDGQLVPIFAGGRTSISTGIGGALGMDFSTLDYNLWHVTDTRDTDAGHGGGNSLAFNYERDVFQNRYSTVDELPDEFGRLDGQSVANTYNFPGGARGVVNSNTFDLFGYAAGDEPTLYFSYYLETDDGAASPANSVRTTDALRVYVVTADGTEHLVASNTDKRTAGSNGDEFDDPPTVGAYDDDINVDVQQLFDNSGSWRQARVPLAEFAGQSNLSLKVEFTTSGTTEAGTDALRAVAADELIDGGTLLINGQTFVIDFAPTLGLPGGAQLASLYADPTERATVTVDGQVYVLDDGTRTINAGEIAVDLLAGQGTATTLNDLNATDIALVVAETVRTQPPPNDLISGFNFSDAEDSASISSGRNDLLYEATQLPYTGGNVTISGTGRLGTDPAQGPVTQLDDVDLSRLDVTAGTTISVTADYPTDAANQPAIRIFDASGSAVTGIVADPVTGTVSYTATYDGAVYIGLSAETNQNYDPRIDGTATSGIARAYEVTVDVNLPVAIVQSGGTIEFGGSTDLTASPNGLFTISGVGSEGGVPIRVSRGMTAEEVALQIQRAVATRFADGNLSRVPVSGQTVNLGTLTLTDPGPFADASQSYGSDFGTSPVEGSRDNDHEGVYLDDFIIGFAERGEQVTGSPVVDTAFIEDTRYAFPEPNDPVSDLVTGSYQVEIRDGSEYIATGQGVQFRTFDTNTRLSEALSIVANSADAIQDGQMFSITDGRSTVEFEFDLIESGTGVTPGRVRIPYTLQAIEAGTEQLDPITNDPIPGTGVVRPQTATEIAFAIIDAINQSDVRAVIDVAALPSSGVDAVTDRVVNLIGDVVVINDQNALANVLRTNLRGDRNRERDSQGVILIENSRFLFNSEYGVDISHDLTTIVDGDETASVIRYPRNLVELNTEDLRPGVVVQSNVFAFNTEGGIQVQGIDPAANETFGDPVPYERIVNNTFIGGTITPGDEAPSGTFEGILFDQGLLSFADAVFAYEPDAGGSPPTLVHQTPNSALGAPDGDGRGPEPADGTTSVSLGLGGSITLQFTDNLLTGSGDSRPDLAIFEVGAIESVLVEISRDGVNYFDVGIIGGLTNVIDIDEYGFGPQERFSFVRLTDLRQGDTVGASLGADIDAIGALSTVPVDQYEPGGTGINITGSAAPTVLNNVISNSEVGVGADPTNNGPVLGGNTYYRNTENTTAGVPLGTFAQTIADTEALFVSAPDLVFAPAAGSSIIDSSIDSLEDRASLTTVRNAVGIPPSPVLAPRLDVNGQLRVDDPNVEPPGGLGESVFKDRGASDRGDLTGPRVTLLTPLAPGVGLDAGRATVTGDPLKAFEIQLVDGIAPADVVPGVGIDDRSVDSGSLILFKDGVPLVEGIDYRFGYNNSTNVIRLTPIAGVWEADSTYVIRMVDRSDAIIRATDGVAYTDGDTLTVIDGVGSPTTFEYETGIVIEVSTGLTPANADGITFEVFDGAVTQQFEFDLNDAVSPLSVPVPIPAAGNAILFAQALADAINADTSLSMTAIVEGNFVQLLGGTPLSSATSPSNFISIAGQIGTRTGFGILVPADGAGVSNAIADGQTFVVRRGALNEVTFELDNNGLLTTAGATAVDISQTSTLDGIADAIVRAIGGAGLGLSPTNAGFGRIYLGGDSNYSLDLSNSGLQQLGLPGEAPTVPIEIPIDQEGLEVVELIQQAIEDQNLIGISSSIVDTRVFLEGTGGVSGVGSVEAVIVKDEVGNLLQSNQVDGRTELTIFIGNGYDYGDAPAPYTSTMSEGGPRHALDPNLSLGLEVTADSDAELPNADQDDGITMPGSFQSGFSATIGIYVKNLDAGSVSDAPVYLDAWFDWDQDGRFEASELYRFGTAGTNRTLIFNNTTTNVLINVPASALSGDTYARFRLSETDGLLPTGDAASGEVEDYRILVTNNPFQNPNGRFDANASGAVTPLDALNIINALARSGGNSINLEVDPVSTPPYPDVNGDGFVSPSDALQVINELARQNSLASGEGELASSFVPAMPGVLASGTTALGDLLISETTAVGSDFLEAQESPVDSGDQNPEDSASSVGEPESKTSVFDSPETMVLDDIVDGLASDAASAGQRSDDGSANNPLDQFFAQL
ncbi:hypothetical protein FYK55_09550 [Roseiconus nitratireducens]|uniref:Uncharacterized protein n=1 Tax=Roseiconus nitratireducens TaxID=2605748 RepID=A0A5M6DAG1_9BACT|nr:GEVED domain-containing protein [Roseiconus nitratireducens]KAA5544554.1 hypothetical protein FYK55_09550 [Roseiconus nitratireducens]